MNLNIVLHGGPRDGEQRALDGSLPYELRLATQTLIAGIPIRGEIVYRRRGGLDSVGLGTEPTHYDYIGPVKRGSRR